MPSYQARACQQLLWADEVPLTLIHDVGFFIHFTLYTSLRFFFKFQLIHALLTCLKHYPGWCGNNPSGDPTCSLEHSLKLHSQRLRSFARAYHTTIKVNNVLSNCFLKLAESFLGLIVLSYHMHLNGYFPFCSRWLKVRQWHYLKFSFLLFHEKVTEQYFNLLTLLQTQLLLWCIWCTRPNQIGFINSLSVLVKLGARSLHHCGSTITPLE